MTAERDTAGHCGTVKRGEQGLESITMVEQGVGESDGEWNCSAVHWNGVGSTASRWITYDGPRSTQISSLHKLALT